MAYQYPLLLVSDRDPILSVISGGRSFVCRETGGQMEVVDCSLEMYLCCVIADHPRSWLSWILWSEFWFNTTFHPATGCPPFELVYRRKPPTITRLMVAEQTRVEAVQKELSDSDEALRQLKLHLHRAQGRMKQFADYKRSDHNLGVGDFFMLRLHRQKSVASRSNAKLAARWGASLSFQRDQECIWSSMRRCCRAAAVTGYGRILCWNVQTGRGISSPYHWQGRWLSATCADTAGW